MKNNTKVLALTLLATTIIATGASFASDTTGTGIGNKMKQMTSMNTEQKIQMEAIKTILEKQKAGTQLTTEEQTQLDDFQANKTQRGFGKGNKGHGEKGGKMGAGFAIGFGMQNLTDEEKTALESMTDAEKKTFFETKKTEFEAKREVRENVIDKLINGENLTTDEEKTRQEMKITRAEMKEVRTLMEKYKNGETLTDEQQAKLDAFQEKMPQKNGKGFGRNK